MGRVGEWTSVLKFEDIGEFREIGLRRIVVLKLWNLKPEVPAHFLNKGQTRIRRLTWNRGTKQLRLLNKH